MAIYILMFVVGACVGSFLNVTIFRLPEKKSIIRHPSTCPFCHQKIKKYDLIPILSYLMLKARCRHCKEKISWQYPAVELITAVAFVFLAYYHDLALDWANPLFFRDIVFAAALIVMFTTDLRYYLLFDAIMVPMMFFAFFANVFILGNSYNYFYVVLNLLTGAIIMSGFFWLQHVVSKGRWIGEGDISLGAVIGFMLGWPQVLLVLFLAYVGGAIISLFLLALGKRNLKSPLPLGTFLCAATFVALIWGANIINWFLGILI